MMSETDDLLDISPGGVPRVSLPAEPEELDAADGLCDRILAGDAASADALKTLAARHPAALSGWVGLGRVALAQGESVSAYAFFRVAYHRGLDKARASGWRGDARIPWEVPSNRPFLRAVHGLAECARAIGEEDEAGRCEEFLGVLDPDHPL